MQKKKKVKIALIILAIWLIIGHLSTYKVAKEIEEIILNRHIIYLAYDPGYQQAMTKRGEEMKAERDYEIEYILVPAKEVNYNLNVYFNICAQYCYSSSDQIFADVDPIFTVYGLLGKTSYVRYSYIVRDKDGNGRCAARGIVLRIRYIWKDHAWKVVSINDISGA